MTCAELRTTSDNKLVKRTSVRRPAVGARYGRSVTTLLVVLSAVAIVAVPVLLGEFPREMARWNVAASQESALNSDYVGAVAHLDRAVAWDAEEPAYYLLRAQYKLETRQWESGLEDCDRARQLAPDAVVIAFTRSQFLQHLGRHESAIEECKELLRREAGATPGRRASLLNTLAYVRAVGKRELREGLEDSDESLQIVMIPSALLDPAGYLGYARGYTALIQQDLELALTSLNEAVQHADAAYKRSVARWESLGKLPRVSQEYEEQVAALRPHLLGILTLRAQLFDELEQPDNAAKDRAWIESLTPSGNRSLEEPIELPAALARVHEIGTYLDTRGYLRLQLGDLPEARRDMQRAVETCQWACRAMSWLFDAQKYMFRDIREFRREQRQMQLSLAVVYYHQMLVHEALGRQEEAARDRARVVELGYEPGEHLF